MIYINEKEHILHEGDWCFIPAFVPNRIDTPADDPHHNYWMHFDLDTSLFSKVILEALLSAFNGYVWHMGKNPVLITILEKMETEGQNKTAGYQLFQQIGFELLLLHLFRACKLERYLSPVTQPLPEVWTKMLYLMQTSYRKIHSVAEIAEEVHISESYCTKLCRTYLGTSPAKYMMQLKMKEAGHLLLYSEHSIQQISRMLGFSSEYHFSNTFRQHFKVSPRSYRNTDFKL